MQLEQLEIFRLGQNGEIVRKIRCLARRVTVFRANKEEELHAFKNALEGKNQSEKFSLLVDGRAFQPEKFTFIGFPDRTGFPPQALAAQYLQSSGMSPEEVDGTLLRYGLGGHAQTKLMDLSNWKRKALLILGATISQQRIIIIDDPFEEMPDAVRELLAQHLADYVWKTHAIVVVTKLSFRPECWIENDIIVRAQLERPRQRTIGFGGAGVSIDAVVQDALDKVRSRKHTERRTLTTARKRLFLNDFISNPIAVAITTFSVLLTVVFLFVIFLKMPRQVSTDSLTIAVLNSSANQKSEAPGPQANVAVDNSSPVQKLQNIKGINVVEYTLDGYPEEVRNAWLAAFHPQQQSAPEEEPLAKKQEPLWASPNEASHPNVRSLYDELNAG